MMLTEEEMEYQSSPSSPVDVQNFSARRRSVSQRRGRSLNSGHVQRLSRTSKRTTSTPKLTRPTGRSSNQSSTNNRSSTRTKRKKENVAIPLVSPIPLSNPPSRSQSQVSPLPFECPSDDEQHQKQNMHITTRSGKMKKDVVLSYFTLRSDGRYDCNICLQPYMAYNGSATNLRRHLFIKHDIAAAIYNSQLSQIKQKSAVANDMPANLPKIRQKQLNKAIFDCIIDDSLPFTTFMKSGMIKLLKTFEPQYEPPSRFTIASQVDKIYHKYVDEILLKRAPRIAFTADIWKSGTRKYYISLTAHLYDKDFEVVPLVLSLRQLTERHLAINVQSFIMYELDEKFHILPQQRAGITTDCGSEMVAATSNGLFGPRYSCIAHVWNNVVKNGLCLWSSPDSTKFPINEDDVDVNESIYSVGGDEDDLLDDEDPDENQWNNDETEEEEDDMNLSPLGQIQSTTLTVVMFNKKPIQTTQDEFLSDDDEPVMIQPETRLITLIGLLERIFNLLNRCRQLIHDMRNIGVVQTFILMEIGKKGRGLTVDMEIRWNTTFQMIDRLLERQTLVDTVVRRKFGGLTVVQMNRLKLAALTPDDWDVLRALHNVLMGFDVATTLISASHYPTLSDSFWAITKLRQILASNKDDSRYTEFLKKSALNYLDIYIQKHLSKEQQEGMLIAAFLDPETHNDLSKNDFTKAIEVVKQKIKEMPTTPSTTLTTTTTSSLSSSSPSHLVLSKKETAKQLMNRLAGINTNQSRIRSMSPEVEVSLFSNAAKTKENFKQFWSTHHHSFPRLVALVHRYCLVPATSVASESAFSIAGFIARKQRSSLSSRTLRHLLVLKYRKNLIKLQSEDEPSLINDHQFQALSLDTAGSSSV
ncbi:unnamed protein product [Rotaria sp. Silwood2]|nr:unnamed protein product [Rotaria sp. Silwood2]